jgi:hypothetical protein
VKGVSLMFTATLTTRPAKAYSWSFQQTFALNLTHTIRPLPAQSRFYQPQSPYEKKAEASVAPPTPV